MISVVVFFDLGDTLVIPRLADDDSLLALNVLPFVPDVLDKLKRSIASTSARMSPSVGSPNRPIFVPHFTRCTFSMCST